jgi:hypothetical protein
MARIAPPFQTMTNHSWNGPIDLALSGHWWEETNQRGFEI